MAALPLHYDPGDDCGLADRAAYGGHAGLLVGYLVFVQVGFGRGYVGRPWFSWCLRRRLATGTNQKSSRYFRVLNEVPTLLMIVIVGLVILKPFA